MYGFKSTRIFNMKDLFQDLTACSAAAQRVGQQLFQQLLPAVSTSAVASCMQSGQDLHDISWQEARLSGWQLSFFVDMACRCRIQSFKLQHHQFGLAVPLGY